MPSCASSRTPISLDLTPIEAELAGYDACFFCLGVSSAGMSEEDYRRVTTTSRWPPATRWPGSTRHRRSSTSPARAPTSTAGAMWARVKGQTENALLALPFEAYMFRPGYIQPMHGVTSRTTWYRLAYVVTAPLYPMLRLLFPSAVTTTERIGQAMITVADRGAPKRILGPLEINALHG